MEKNKIYYCIFCSASSNKLSNLERHVQKIHKTLYCGKCGTTFNIDKTNEFKQHIGICPSRRTITEKKYKCELCNYSIDKKKRLDYHIINQHKSMTCRNCQIVITDCKMYEVHNKTCRKSPAKKVEQKLVVSNSKPSTSTTNNSSGVNNIQLQDSSIDNYGSRLKNMHSLRINIDNINNIMFPSVDFENELKQEFQFIYSKNWKSIMSFFRLSKVMHLFNFRMTNSNSIREIGENLRRYVFPNMHRSFKIFMSPSMILMNRNTGELRYYYPSRFNFAYTDNPALIRNKTEFEKYVDEIANICLEEEFGSRRPNSEYNVLFYTAITFYIYETHIPLGLIGGTIDLSQCVLLSKFVITMLKDKHYGTIINDNLCFFRCLLLHQRKTIDNCLDRLPYLQEQESALKLASNFYNKIISANNFKGVKMTDLPALELYFKVNINVFQSEYLSSKNRNTIIARTIYISPGGFDSTLNLDECNNHFSYITNIKEYAKAFWCKKCDKAFLSSYRCRTHEKKCLAKRMLKFIENPFRPRYNLIQTLQNEGFDVNGISAIYPYCATFDCEAYFENGEQLEEINDESCKYATHKLLSIAVTSNIPQFEDPVCFINDGNEYAVFLQFIKYLNKISKHAQR